MQQLAGCLDERVKVAGTILVSKADEDVRLYAELYMVLVDIVHGAG